MGAPLSSVTFPPMEPVWVAPWATAIAGRMMGRTSWHAIATVAKRLREKRFERKLRCILTTSIPWPPPAQCAPDDEAAGRRARGGDGSGKAERIGYETWMVRRGRARTIGRLWRALRPPPGGRAAAPFGPGPGGAAPPP